MSGEAAKTDFNQVLLDIDGEEMQISDPSPEQTEKMQELQLVANHPGTPLERAEQALEAFQKLRREVLVPHRLGQVCAAALMSSDDKADGVQMLVRTKLALKIKGDSADADFAELALKSAKKELIEKRVADSYKHPIIYARVFEALEGSLEENDEE
jgi:hypothetical protein